MSVEIAWSRLALRRLREIHDYVARDKPEAAENLTTRILTIVEALSNYPHLGRVGVRHDIRELVVGGTPYIIVYRLQRSRIVINTVLHGVRRRKKK